MGKTNSSEATRRKEFLRTKLKIFEAEGLNIKEEVRYHTLLIVIEL